MSDRGGLARLEALPPGPELFAGLVALGPVARRTADDAGVREVLPDSTDQVLVARLWQKLQGWVDLRLDEAVLQIAGSRIGPDEEDWGREEVAAGLRWSNFAAADRIEVARALNGRCFLTRRALEQGRITYRHAVELVHALEPLDDEAAATVEAALLDTAGSKTPGQLARKARREVAKADPGGADERHRKARKGRRVDFTPLPDGMAELHAILPADQAARARAAIDQFSGRVRCGGDDRTLDQRRADALVALIDIGAHTATRATGRAPDAAGAASQTPGAAGAAGGMSDEQTATLVRTVLAGRRATPPRIALTAPLSTVLGATDLPGDLPGYGPVPASVVRELAADSRWEKWITDPGGVVTDLGHTTYRPTARLAALVRAAYPTCMFPGCSQPSYRCDLDHNVRHIDGGPTSATNLVPLCRRHHRAQDEAGWDLVHHPDTGACTWTSPAGHTYTVAPPDQGEPETAVIPDAWTEPLRPEPALVGGRAPADEDAPPF
ncbi:HNH endonuclease signature motif containing protein [Cryptosporangium minutisporangium]|uniref:HNH endonuclease signature motif containing protein n=1 Tax=Cryptosporangium minutisporangium TaxID=113569 RepID=A0ABP6T3B1_9ACTN